MFGLRLIPFWVWLSIGAAALLGAIGYHAYAVNAAHRAGVAEEHARCEARIQKSIDDARKADADAAMKAAERAQENARKAEERAREAEQRSDEYEAEIAKLEPALRDCRRAVQSDVDRLR